MQTFQVAPPVTSQQQKDSHPSIHYVYICIKIEGADEQALAKWDEVEAQIKKEEQADEDDLMNDSSEDNEEDRELKEGEEIMRRAVETGE